MREGLTFDDVLLVPQYSDIESRGNVDISVRMNDLVFSHPIIPANMLTVTGRDMAYAVVESGGLAVLNRFLPIAEQILIAEDIIDLGRLQGVNHFGISVGVKDEDKNNLGKFAEMGVRIVCVDVAHGDSTKCYAMTRWIRDKFPKMFIISGNVATGVAAKRMWEAGANAVKVGVGPGSLCTTRIETGNGIPQLSALMDVYAVRSKLRFDEGYYSKPQISSDKIGGFYIIADGGIKSAGDTVKALCYSDMVMIGNLFAGALEAPGKRIDINGASYKEYVGSSTHKTTHVEGVAALVPYKGTYKEVLTKLTEGLRSGCSYQGARNLTELRDNPEFIRITSAGLRESHPHDVTIK